MNQNALTRQEIVRAVITLADTGGLVDLMLDEVSAEVDVPATPGEDWRGDLRAVICGRWRPGSGR